MVPSILCCIWVFFLLLFFFFFCVGSRALFPLCAVSIPCSSPVYFPSTPASRRLHQPSRVPSVLPAPSLHSRLLHSFPSPLFFSLCPPAPHPFVSLACVVISSSEFVESSVVFAWSCCYHLSCPWGLFWINLLPARCLWHLAPPSSALSLTHWGESDLSL